MVFSHFTNVSISKLLASDLNLTLYVVEKERGTGKVEVCIRGEADRDNLTDREMWLVREEVVRYRGIHYC